MLSPIPLEIVCKETPARSNEKVEEIFQKVQYLSLTFVMLSTHGLCTQDEVTVSAFQVRNTLKKANEISTLNKVIQLKICKNE